VVVPELVRRAALWPDADVPDPPPEHPYEVIRREGFIVGVFPGMTFGSVYPQALPAEGIQDAVDGVRSLLVERDISQGAWFVPEAASPAGLAERLRQSGMVPYEEAPLEPRFAAMVMLTQPPTGPPAVEARPTRSFREYQAGARVADDVFEMNEQDRRVREKQERLLWKLQSSGRSPYRSFVAVVDGDIVGYAGALFGANAVFLAGGSTRPDMRRRGVYRALVRARWDAASESGTPALTVAAGRMSRPILERLGFTIVGWVDCLLDRFPDHPPPASTQQ
jgi:GNAT superfamily N-acetyltransferase